MWGANQEKLFAGLELILAQGFMYGVPNERGARDVMAIVIGNGLDISSSNHGWDCLYFPQRYYPLERYASNYSLSSYE